MVILPAIDLKDGMCVRLHKGDFDTVHKVAEDAITTAKNFEKQGAEILHMVDLDAAKTGDRTNYKIVRDVIENTNLKVELGGGIRTIDDIEYALSFGVFRVVIGSAAVSNPEFVRQATQKYGDKIAVGIDSLSGSVRTDGWIKDSGKDYISLAKEMESFGVKYIIFTDISKDGMLEGPNFDELLALRNAVSCEIIASGGVSCISDIVKLNEMKIDGAIAGKAVYTGDLDLAQAIKEAKK